VRGRGWDQNRWPGQAFPTLERLDQAFPDQPAYMVRIDMHAAMANSAALALAGVDAGTRVDGGRLVQAEGRPTGLLVDNAMGLVERAIPAPDRAAREQALLAAQRHCFSLGLTTVADAGIDRDDVLLLDAMHRDGRLKLRVYAMLRPTEENFACLLRGTVHCIGGGPDGRLGQDAVFAGWIQNIATFHVSGTYLDSAHPNETKDVMMHVTSNQLQGTEKSNHDRYFLNGGAALAPLDVGAAVGTEAMLDTGRTPAGGSSVLLSRSVMNAPANDDILGWRIKASAGDSRVLAARQDEDHQEAARCAHQTSGHGHAGAARSRKCQPLPTV